MPDAISMETSRQLNFVRRERCIRKDHLSLSKEENWMVNGVALPADAKRGTTKPSLSLHVRKLSDNTTVRILVFQNGAGQDGCEVIAAVDQTEKLDYALDNNTEIVTKKEILSMTMEELYNNKEEVNQLIDELRPAIKKHKGQLSKLALQLQAEEDQCAGYVYQHIKQLSTRSRDPQGLQLKVYENGQDTEETVVYINRKLKGCGKDVKLMMDRAYSEFVLTYLEELNVREEVTQTEKHNHHGAWSSEHQETEDSGYNVSDTNQKQVPRPIDAQSMPPGALRESIQLTVALVRKLEDKHPKASAQK
ncbi:Doublecortin domain-containing protein 1 [Acipenser ruthenus]|uniref:Doublecortin domain-containing protein 1 n=1 Tax=Acipenser ruthenus TaxID=7906 RepID=A0A444U0Z7_ACIRT|nr:Doublecortin domain-containing protein 1 [Acipenser ruthenus]